MLSKDTIFDGTKRTSDWGLELVSIQNNFPDPKIYKKEVPGANGAVDVTDNTTGGDVKYKERTITLTYDTVSSWLEWSALVSEIAAYLHGQRRKLVLPTDPSYYYIGRFTISTTKSNPADGELVIVGTVDPYKYELTSSMEPWLWKPFRFKGGIIRNYRSLTVNGTLTLTIRGRRKRVIPVIYCTAPMTLAYNGQTYQLEAGRNKRTNIALGEGDHQLVFSGHGTVSIDYRGGAL